MSTVTFACAVCGQPAATVELQVTNNSATLMQTGFMGHITESLSQEAIPAIHQAISQASGRLLYDLNLLWAPFYCPDCEQVYCRQHWLIIPQFDDDFPGWYDCAYGTCPQGHRRLVDD